MSLDADVCIVGAGAGGAVAAWALARRNVNVLLLEAGPRFAPADYGSHDYARSRGFNVAALRAKGLIMERPGTPGQGKPNGK